MVFPQPGSDDFLKKKTFTAVGCFTNCSSQLIHNGQDCLDFVPRKSTKLLKSAQTTDFVGC